MIDSSLNPIDFTCKGYKHSAIKPYRDFLDHSYISLVNNYYFHTIGKAANSTVKSIFYDFELKAIPRKIPSVHDRASSPLLSPFQLSNAELQKVFCGNEFTRFLFVRNPYSRLLSCFLDRIQDKKSRPFRQLCKYTGRGYDHSFSFDEFIAAICSQADHEQNNHWRLMYADSLSKVIDYSFIGKQESFASDMKNLLEILAIPCDNLAVEDRSNSPNSTDSSKKLSCYWTKNLVSLVNDRYSQDFEFFDYQRGIEF